MKYQCCIQISLYIWFCNISFCIGMESFRNGNNHIIPTRPIDNVQNLKNSDESSSSSTSSSSSSSYNNNNNNNKSNGNSYRSINELNEYGSSPQINNARLASTLHGALTIVALSIPSNCIVVTSFERKLPGVIIQDNNGGSTSSKIQILAKEKSQKIQAIIGSGLQSDITFITSLLRKHLSLCWERYDSIPSLDKITLDTTEIMTCFMGYDVNDEIRDGTKSILYNYNGDDEEDETISIGRPLACNLLFVEVMNEENNLQKNAEQEGGGGGNDNQLYHRRNYCDMKLVDPGGIVSQSLVGQAIGRGSKKANELLRQGWNDQLSIDELEEKCVQIIRHTVEDEGIISADGELDDATIVCERLNTEGIKITRLPFIAKKIASTKEAS